MAYQDALRGRWSCPGQEYLLTFVTESRRCLFADFRCARLFVAELRSVAQDGLADWPAWVLMPDHFHGLISLDSPLPLSRVVQRLKGRSAQRINQRCERYGRVWQPGFHERALRREDDRRSIARYIVANPLRAGLVRSLGDYPHWDCRYL